jgi:hypothetical protein
MAGVKQFSMAEHSTYSYEEPNSLSLEQLDVNLDKTVRPWAPAPGAQRTPPPFAERTSIVRADGGRLVGRARAIAPGSQLFSNFVNFAHGRGYRDLAGRASIATSGDPTLVPRSHASQPRCSTMTATARDKSAMTSSSPRRSTRYPARASTRSRRASARARRA